MTAIDPRASLVHMLQARLAAPARGPVRAGASGASGAARAASHALAQQLAAIDRTDPDRRRKAVRLVLEAQLAREFGTGLLNDPGLPGMLEAVQRQMEGDAQAAAAVQALGDWLLAAPA